MSNAYAFLAKSETLANLCGQDVTRHLRKFLEYIFPGNTSLLSLTSDLCEWNSIRVKQNQDSGLVQALSVEDIALIKHLIDAAIKRSSAECSEVFTDQILFLVIGAIQIQAQTHSDKAWQLVSQSIKNTVKSKNEKKWFQLSIYSTAFIICMSTMMISNSKIQEMQKTTSSYSVEKVIASTDPVTISMLELAYNKMKGGTCQLPQAAMLPVEQRNAYLNFINKGVIEVQHVENLRQALGYVNCLYPQELMHPRLPDEK